MAIKVIVFDFDGTLVDSNQLKYDAFFELFAQDEFHKRIITEVLKKFFNESRYIILKQILKRIKKDYSKEIDIDAKADELADKYNTLILSRIKTCKEKAGAVRVLENLSRKYRLYLSSTTPESALRDIIKYRNWHSYFCDIFGYPKEKVCALLEIIRKEKVNPNEVLMVGDAKVDRISANKVGCRFFSVNENGQLGRLLGGAGRHLE